MFQVPAALALLAACAEPPLPEVGDAPNPGIAQLPVATVGRVAPLNGFAPGLANDEPDSGVVRVCVNEEVAKAAWDVVMGEGTAARVVATVEPPARCWAGAGAVEDGWSVRHSGTDHRASPSALRMIGSVPDPVTPSSTRAFIAFEGALWWAGDRGEVERYDPATGWVSRWGTPEGVGENAQAFYVDPGGVLTLWTNAGFHAFDLGTGRWTRTPGDKKQVSAWRSPGEEITLREGETEWSTHGTLGVSQTDLRTGVSTVLAATELPHEFPTEGSVDAETGEVGLKDGRPHIWGSPRGLAVLDGQLYVGDSLGVLAIELATGRGHHVTRRGGRVADYLGPQAAGPGSYDLVHGWTSTTGISPSPRVTPGSPTGTPDATGRVWQYSRNEVWREGEPSRHWTLGTCHVPLFGMGLECTCDVTELTPDADGTMWAATEECGLLRFDAEAGGRTQVPLPAAGSWTEKPTHILADPRGGLWVGLNSGDLLHLDAAGLWRRWKAEAVAGPGSVRSLALDAEGGLWVGGLRVAWLPAGETAFLHPTPPGMAWLKGGEIAARADGVWIANETTGTRSYVRTDTHAESWRIYTNPNSRWDTRDDESAGWPDDAPQSWRTTAPRGPMIAGTGQRWLRFGDGLLTAPPPVTGVDDSGAWSYVAAGPLNETLPAADGGLWTLEGNGVYKRAADGSIAASTGVEAGVLSLAAGGDDLLIAAIDDAYRWRPGRFFGALTALGLKAPVASVREARDGAVWAGLMSKDRVARVDAETGDIHYFGDDVRGRVDGLAEDDAGGIWAATTAGAWRIEPKDGTIRRWTRATGLLGDEQTEVFVKGSAVWFRGPAGVSAWDPKLSAWVHTEKSLPTPLGATASGPIVVTHEGAAAWMDGAWVGQASSPFPITALAWEAGAAAEDAWDFLLSTGDVLSGNGAGETTLSSPPLFPVAAIARSHGRVCVGGAGLACRTQGAAWVNVSPGLAEGESVTALVMTPQAAWVGTSAGRLCREGSPCFDAGVGSVAALSLGPEGTLFAAGTAGIAAITAGAPIELFDGPTTSLAYDPITGVLWAGTPTGLLRVAPDGTIADLGGGVPRDPTGWGGCAVPGHLPGELLPGRIDALAMDGRGRLYVRQGEALYDLDARASSANLIPPAPASSPSWR